MKMGTDIATSQARTNSQSKFVVELQSLRGVAAMMVMIHHSLRCIAPTPITHGIADNVLNAHAAVVVFFVLSGYVLSSTLEASGVGPRALVVYYVRRVFRIYPALFVGVLLGGIYYLGFRGMQSAHLSHFMLTNYLPERITPAQVVLTFLGLQMVLLPPLWTITIEIFASIVMPAIIWLRMRSELALLALTLALAVVSFLVPVGFRLVPVYLVDFALGACTFAFRESLSRLSVHPLVTIIAVVFLLYFHHLADWGYSAPFPALVEALASVVLIMGIERQHARFLRWQPLTRLGDWSYSIYLIHVPIAFSLARVIDRIFGDSAPLLAQSLLLMMATCVLTIPLAAFFFHHVEQRGVAMGKKVAAACTNRLQLAGERRGFV